MKRPPGKKLLEYDSDSSNSSEDDEQNSGKELLKYLIESEWSDYICDECNVDWTDDIFRGAVAYSLKNRKSKYHSFKSAPLFTGSLNTVQDLGRSILGLRQRFSGRIGDQIQSSVMGLLTAFLPEDNILKSILPINPSMYQLNELIKDIGLSASGLKSFKIPICINGCY